MDDDDEQVEIACRGYRKAVRGFFRRYTRLPSRHDDQAEEEEQQQQQDSSSNKNQQQQPSSLPRDVTHLLDHVSHFARQLTKKRNSLKHGLSYLKGDLWPQILKGFFVSVASGVGSGRSSSNSSSAEQVALLQHFLSQCLRLHDGIFLLVSGECRHSGDIRLAKKQQQQTSQKQKLTLKFPSQLALNDARKDGYTKLYNAPGGYSGYGWDEFHDPELGLQTRLLRALQHYAAKSEKRKSRDSIADYLLEHGGQALESLLDHHESEMRPIKEGFTMLRDRVVRDLQQKFRIASATSNSANSSNSSSSSRKTVKIAFTLHDKMEKLQVGNIVLERHGNTFQVNDPRGALPNGYKVKDWSGVMKLPTPTTNTNASSSASTRKSTTKDPTTNKAATTSSNSVAGSSDGAKVGKKLRRVILDDSSDEGANNDKQKVTKQSAKTKQSVKLGRQQQTSKEVDLPRTPVAKATSSGLQVKIKEVAKSPTIVEGTSLSLATIKTQMGVNIQALEAAREELEKEEADASKAAKADEAEAMATTIAEGESSIRSQRRVLGRVVARKDRDVKEIWDARELLREQLMTVGNQILWDPTTSEDGETPGHDRKGLLLVALTYFKEAKGLVKDQEVFRRQLNSQGKYTPTESRFFSRNLLLLEGQAHTNLGITNIEMATQAKRKTKYATKESISYLSQAMEELSTAQQFAEALRSRADLDRKRGSNSVETCVDCVRAVQLESLALRWWGTALWLQGHRKEATVKFQSGASFFAETLRHLKPGNVMDDKGVLEAMRQLGADCFYACTATVDLASADMEELPPRGAAQEGNEVIAIIQKVLTLASELGGAVCAFLAANPGDNLTPEEYMEENQIMTQEAVLAYLAEIEKWWKRRRDVANRPIAVDTLLPKRRPILLQRRSEVEHLGLDRLPTRVFTVSEVTGTGRGKKRKGPNPSYHKHSGDLLSALPRQYRGQQNNNNGFTSNTPPPTQYRPWGDELLPQIIDEATGRSIPKIVYPSVAPVMPPEMWALQKGA